VKLSSFLRYSLEFKENELTNLSDELDHIEQYLAIEKVRFGKRMQPDIQYGDDCKDCRLPNMILQPLFENAIKHGVYESTDPVEIKTHIRKEGDILRISLFNTFDPEAPPRKGKGIGLRHVANRLSLVYQLDNLMHVDKADNTFTVTLIIPQITIS
ncbi:MAG: histidine kinase, partial [Bacteroidetes bacterium]|nr:histidine kinase [Bacteroidota bacterium]